MGHCLPGVYSDFWGGCWVKHVLSGKMVVSNYHGNPQPSFLSVIEGLKPAFFMVLGSKGIVIVKLI